MDIKIIFIDFDWTIFDHRTYSINESTIFELISSIACWTFVAAKPEPVFTYFKSAAVVADFGILVLLVIVEPLYFGRSCKSSNLYTPPVLLQLTLSVV